MTQMMVNIMTIIEVRWGNDIEVVPHELGRLT